MLKQIVIKMHLPIFITENVSACEDSVENGRVHDVNRVDYLNRHLEAVAKMNNLGYNIAGYYAWSLLDNFEWAFGYSRRFGIVYVDYETQERVKKDSFYRFKEVIETSKRG